MIGTINNKNLNISNFTKLNEIIITGLDEKNNEQMINNLSFLKSKKTYNIIKLYLILLFFIGVFLIIFTDFYLNSELKFKNTDSYIFKMALISIFPLSIFRLMVMKDCTKFREHRIIYIVVPIIAYIIYIIMSNLSIYDFSRSFVFLSFFVLLYYFVISFLYKFKN